MQPPPTFHIIFNDCGSLPGHHKLFHARCMLPGSAAPAPHQSLLRQENLCRVYDASSANVLPLFVTVPYQ